MLVVALSFMSPMDDSIWAYWVIIAVGSMGLSGVWLVISAINSWMKSIFWASGSVGVVVVEPTDLGGV
ncbi:hypothetical protein D3C72_2198220 [compost metagenome]